jgi:serine O-acetyltransferase
VHVAGGPAELVWRLSRHIDAFCPRRNAVRSLDAIVEPALERLEVSFGHSALPGYWANGGPQFDPAHTDQYAQFIWICSNEAWKAGDVALAADLFGLNKALNAVVCMWDTALPPTFAWIHCVGAVLGKAEYGDRFVAYQNVTVGTDRGARPILGERTILFAGAVVAGAAVIGDRTVVSPNSVIIGETIPPDSVVAGRSPQLIVKPRKRWLYGDYFNDDRRA